MTNLAAKEKTPLEAPFDEYEAARQLGVAVQTLRNWRSLRRGPAYIKVGRRRIAYLPEDIRAYRQKRRIDPETL